IGNDSHRIIVAFTSSAIYFVVKLLDGYRDKTSCSGFLSFHLDKLAMVTFLPTTGAKVGLFVGYIVRHNDDVDGSAY
ncbi:MAG: hypothetical protein ABF702_12975, partial [Lacticaseibacillus paracasei]